MTVGDNMAVFGCCCFAGSYLPFIVLKTEWLGEGGKGGGVGWEQGKRKQSKTSLQRVREYRGKEMFI